MPTWQMSMMQVPPKSMAKSFPLKELSKSSDNSNDKVCILNSLDGGYYLVGNCDQIYILKTDAEGKVLAKYIKEPDPTAIETCSYLVQRWEYCHRSIKSQTSCRG